MTVKRFEIHHIPDDQDYSGNSKLEQRDPNYFYVGMGVAGDYVAPEETIQHFPLIEFNSPMDREFAQISLDYQLEVALNPFRSFWACLIKGCQDRTLAYMEKVAKKLEVDKQKLLRENGVMWILKIGGGTQDIELHKKSQDTNVDIPFNSPRLFYAADLLSKVRPNYDLECEQLIDLRLNVDAKQQANFDVQFEITDILEITATKFKKDAIRKEKDDPLYSFKHWLSEIVLK